MSTLKIIQPEDAAAAHTRARDEFVSRLHARHPEATDPTRQQVDPMIPRWWPLAEVKP